MQYTVTLTCWPEDTNRVQHEETLIDREILTMPELKKRMELVARKQFSEIGSRGFGRTTPNQISNIEIDVFRQWNTDTNRPFDLAAALEYSREDWLRCKQMKWYMPKGTR